MVRAADGEIKGLLEKRGLRVAAEYGIGGPDWRGVAAVHRAGDGWIQFSQRHPDGSGEGVIGSARPIELEQWFPQFRAQLLEDSYYSLAAFWRPATGKTADLRYLNTAWVDLDVRLSWGLSVGLLLDVLDLGVIPCPSVFVRSGRGLWALWLLSDPQAPERGQRAYRGGREVRLLEAVNRSLAHRIATAAAPLLPDFQAVNAARISRIPGSVNTKASEQVRYLVLAGANGTALYSLEDLGARLGLGLPETPRRLLLPSRTGTAPARRRGWRAMHQLRLLELDVLREACGGWRAGHRAFGLWLEATSMRALGVAPDAILARCLEHARACRSADGRHRDPLPDYEVRAAVEKACQHRYKLRNAKIAETLGVSVEAADALGLTQLRPDYQRRPRSTRRQDRRAALAALLRDCPRASIRELVRLLEERGVRASRSRVQADLRALGLARKRPVDPTGALFL